MKNLKHLFTALLLLCATVATAHDFEVGGIYYNITSTTDFTVEVTYRGSSYNEYSNEYSGNVVIPESVTYNGSTYSVTSIGRYAFEGCSALTCVEIPNSVTSIGYSAFEGCSALTSVEIPNSVTSIGYSAFYGCSGLKKVINFSSLTFSKGSTYYGYVAYYAETVINAPNGSVEGDFAFGVIDGVNTLCAYIGAGGDVTLPADYNGENYAIGSYVFRNNTSITSVVIPNSVTSIGSDAFYGCNGLTSVVIPNSVTSIGSSAFSYCSGLTSVVIGNSVTSIGYYAFRDCSGLTSVVIPNSVTSIGDDAFWGCRGLTSVVIPNSVTSIGERAFYNCSGLTSVVIPNSVTSIGGAAFYGCRGLTSVVIPNSVTSIGDYAFENCRGLTSVEIPNSVTSIGYAAFEGCSALTSVVIPNSVTSIGDYAFYSCSGLTSVVIGNGVTSIGGFAFRDCSGLTSVVIGNGVTSIGGYAFSYCSGLTSVVIPNSVTSIGAGAFYECSGLKKVINFSSLRFSKGSTSYGDVAYYADTVINAPNGSVEGDFVFGVIDGVNTLCAYISAGGDITLPADYNGENYAIGADVFKNNTSLTSVVIGNGVISIGDGAFRGCSGLTAITSMIPAEDLFSVANDAFDYNCVLYVPKGAKETYASTEGWSNFENIVETDFTGIDEVKGENGNVEGVYYDLNGRAVERPANGLYIKNGKKVFVK